MKLLFYSLLVMATVSNYACQPQKKAMVNCYKGRLEIKALCMNYTIKVLDSGIDRSLIVDQWKDESTGKTYTNVFALGSRCTFPANLKEGDEFYFTINNTPNQDCAVCMAYYPVPEKKLSIKVLPGVCQ
ncbi:MAG: hypothetical protein JWP69_1864 [Flaviaesturariibacter sp.]|nr:hypothetical protein [Flaviaesturariibacter sp.]